MSNLATSITWLLGIVLTVVGVLGFVPSLVTDGLLLGIFEVDALHNVIHLASGVIGMFAATKNAARTFLFVFGIVYALVAVLGFVMGGDVLGLFHVNQADNYLHAAIALVCLGVGFNSKK